jgi:two-component system, chemotaxis family, chemotaxis protein CheY
MPAAIIVDDSPIMRGMLRKLLAQAGFTIAAEAGAADEVLALYERHRPDLITLDIVMPGRDGAALAVELLGRHPEANVVMCTSMSTRDKIDTCKRAGVRYYLLKPLQPEHAIAVFRRALARQSGVLPRFDVPAAPDGASGIS